MTTLKAGGPDAEGYFISDDGDIVFGHRRLAILDLTVDGNQPMSWGNWTITYNGEIYNYKEIRNELISFGYNFRTNTDTEVIIKSFDCWGTSALNKFIGMFAFAIYNKVSNLIYLCRDKLGIKPLYYYLKDDFFMFSSEIKAFHEIPHFDKSINIENLNSYFSKGYFNEEYSIFRYVTKLKPGTFLEVNSSGLAEVTTYWDLLSLYESTTLNNLTLEENLVVVDEIIGEAIKRRLVADVEIGVLLSGGIDSSLIAAYLKKFSKGVVKSFTIGFEDGEYDESPYASAIARNLNLEHNHINCTRNDVIEILPKLSRIFDEPFGDISAIPTILVSNFASKSIKVVLSGDGGDELFGGYSRYKFVKSHLYLLKIPLFIRRAIIYVFSLVGHDNIRKILSILLKNKYTNIDDKYFKLRQVLIAKNINDLCNSCTTHVDNSVINKFTKTKSIMGSQLVNLKLTKNEIVTKFGILDLLTYLPGDIMQKVDRGSMSTGLEAREPLLDQDLLAFSFTIPEEYKITNKGDTKHILKRLLNNYISSDLIDRPKSGFSVPIDDWLKTIFRADFQKLLESESFFETYKLDKKYLVLLYNQYLKGNNVVSPHFFWYVLTLFNWHQEWIINDSWCE